MVHSSNAIVRNFLQREEETFRPPREEDPPSREPTPPPAVATLVGVYVVRLQRRKATDQDRRRPVGGVGLASTATAIATVLMIATDIGMTTPLEIGAIEEDDAIRETGVGVRLVIGDDTTTTASTTGGENRRLELLTTAVRTTAGRGADRGVLLLLLLLMRDGEATIAIAMSQDEEEVAVMAIVTGEGETTDRWKERGTISVAGSTDSPLKQARFSCNSAHCVAPYGLQSSLYRRERIATPAETQAPGKAPLSLNLSRGRPRVDSVIDS